MPGRHIYGLLIILNIGCIYCIMYIILKPDLFSKNLQNMLCMVSGGGGEYRQSQKSTRLREKRKSMHNIGMLGAIFDVFTAIVQNQPDIYVKSSK
jgi:hypothetical protein